MMNGVTLDNQTPQVAFRARKINDIKKAHRIVDQINDAAIEFLHKDRPIEEKRETMIRQFISDFNGIVLGKSKKNKLVETANKPSREANLEVLRETDPDAYKEAIKRQKEELVMEAYNNAYENFVMKRLWKEDPEKAKVIMRNRIIAATNEQISKKLSPKNLMKMYCDYLTTKTAIGIGKLLGKCDKTLNKIPFIKEARNKRIAEIEQTIEQRFKDGVIDSDHAGELLVKKDSKITKA